MTIVYHLDVPNRLVLTEATGTLTLQNLIAHKLALLADAGFGPDWNELFDARGLTRLELSADDAWRLAEFDWAHVGALRSHRLAVVVSRDAHHGAFRMYQHLTEEHLPQVAVFRRVAEAALWLSSGAHTDPSPADECPALRPPHIRA